MIDPVALRSLVAVERLGSVGAAATALEYTPSAVSQQIKRLESQTGVQLLERRGSLGAPPDASSSGTVTEQRKTDAGVHDSCPGPRTTDGAVPSPVRYGGDLAVLVVHPERDGHRLVEAWDCAGNRRLDQARLTP